MRRVLVVGNSGSGKTTLARQLAAEGLSHLDLDTLAWLPAPPPVRRPLAESAADIDAFTHRHDAWVIEGCYADLLAIAVARATDLIFLNPGVEVCARHCRARPWEPHKYASPGEQDRNLGMLLDWVRGYATRDDACSLASHRRLFDEFVGRKREMTEAVMAETTPAEIEGARAYEALFVPSLIGVWAPVVADAAAIAAGDRVLDVACGTGVLAREVARRAGPRGMVAGIDPNGGMLAVARELSAAIDYRSGAAEALPFADASFDAVVSQFGLMFFRDRAGAVGEMRRVLRPAGRLAVAVWAGLDSMPAFAAEVRLFEAVAGPVAADALRAPFVLGDAAALAALFEAPGLPPPAIATSSRPARFASVRTLVEADLRGWLPIMGVHLEEDVIAATLARADDALSPYVTRAADGAIAFTSTAHVVRQAMNAA